MCHWICELTLFLYRDMPWLNTRLLKKHKQPSMKPMAPPCMMNPFKSILLLPRMMMNHADLGEVVIDVITEIEVWVLEDKRIHLLLDWSTQREIYFWISIWLGSKWRCITMGVCGVQVICQSWYITCVHHCLLYSTRPVSGFFVMHAIKVGLTSWSILIPLFLKSISYNDFRSLCSLISL